MLFTLPNLLTYARIGLIPAFVALMMADEPQARAWAVGLFVLSAVTDFLDGYLARALDQHSALGRMLDPIADKLLVAAALVLLVADGGLGGVHAIAALVILTREVLVSGLREFLAGTGGPSIPVTLLAKLKTAVQMVAIAVALAAPVAPVLAIPALVLIWLAAVLTVVTGAQYLRAALGAAIALDRGAGPPGPAS